MIHTIVGTLQRWGFSRAGWRDNRRGEWWLLAQLVLIALDVVLPTWPSTWAWPPLLLPWLPATGLVLLLGGLLLAGVAFVQLGESLTPLPEPMPSAPLKQLGLYGICRHPLYLAVLICSALPQWNSCESSLKALKPRPRGMQPLHSMANLTSVRSTDQQQELRSESANEPCDAHDRNALMS